MTNQLLLLSTFFEALPAHIRRHRCLFWLFFICLTGAALAGLPRFKIDMSWNALLEPDEPVKIAYDRFRAVFGSDEVLYLAYEAKDGDVFSTRSLRALSALQKELESKIAAPLSGADNPLNHITDITSLINASFLEGKHQTLISRDFIGDIIPSNPRESDLIRKKAQEHPDYPLIFCSRDSRFSGIVIRTDFNARIRPDSKTEKTETSPDSAIKGFNFVNIGPDGFRSPLDDAIPEFETTWMGDYVPFMTKIHDIITKKPYTDHLIFYPAGTPELMGFLAKELEKEMAMIILGSLALILIVLGVVFRSASAVIWPFVIILSTLFWTLGSMGWSGIAMTDFINIVIFLLIAVGVADSVHILSGYLYYIRLGRNHETAICTVYKKSGPACFLASLTTATGLLALGFAPIVAIQRLALFSAAGVMYAFFITVTMLPLMLDIANPAARKERKAASHPGPKIQRFLACIELPGTRYPGRTLMAFAVAAILLFPGIFRMEIDSNVLTIIRENRPIRKNFDTVDTHLAGTGNIEILVDTGEPDGLKSPAILKAMGRLQTDLEQNFSDIVYKTQSLFNVTCHSYRVLNEGRQEAYAIPDDPATLSQTLFLFSSANPKDRRILVSDDFRAARIIVNTRNLGSREGSAFMKILHKKIDAHFSGTDKAHPKFRIEATGQIPMFQRMMDMISWSQIQSFGICLILVSVILFLVLKDVKTGLTAIIPNLFPIFTVFGIMGWLSIPLDVHTLLVMPIIIGISVDDTIHFMTHFNFEMHRHKTLSRAVSIAVKEAGQAIVFTSLVLAVGYLAFLGCVNKGFAYFGFLSAIAVLTALAADLLLLPALICLGTAGPETAVSDKTRKGAA